VSEKMSDTSTTDSFPAPAQTTTTTQEPIRRKTSKQQNGPRSLPGWAIAVIVIVVVAIVIVVVVVSVVVTGENNTPQSGLISGQGQATRTVFMPGGVVSGNSQVPATIQGDFVNYDLAALPWSINTFPNSYFFVAANNNTSTPLYTITWSQFSFVTPPNAGVTGNLVVSGSPTQAANNIGMGFFGLGFNPSATVPIDPLIPFSGIGSFNITNASNPFGTIEITLPANLPSTFSDYFVFAQNTTGTNHNLLLFNGGEVLSSNTIAVGYTHLNFTGTVQTGPGTFVWMVVSQQTTPQTGSTVVYAAYKTYTGTSGTGTFFRVEQNLPLGVTINNPTNSLTWFAFGDDPSGQGNTVSAIQQTSSTTISLAVTAPQTFSCYIFCVYGVNSEGFSLFNFAS
jgi:hypothetical protein